MTAKGPGTVMHHPQASTPLHKYLLCARCFCTGQKLTVWGGGQCPGAAQNNTDLCSHISGGQNSKMKVSGGLVFPPGSGEDPSASSGSGNAGRPWAVVVPLTPHPSSLHSPGRLPRSYRMPVIRLAPTDSTMISSQPSLLQRPVSK